MTGVQQGAVSGTYEDAFLYMDTRGNWHGAWGSGRTSDHNYCTADDAISAHALSAACPPWFVQ